MSLSEPAQKVADRTPPLAYVPVLEAVVGHRAPGEAAGPGPTFGITVFGSELDEAALFREMAPRFGIVPVVTDVPASAANVELASGNRCISVGHKSQISKATLLALRQAGVTYISTRSVGYDHIDVPFAASVGIFVENVTYSPDSVADYTLMMMLMAVRNAKTTISRAQDHDYRLNDAPGRELRDMSIGVVGTGRIGAAVIHRLSGFGCRVLAYDPCPNACAQYITLDALLQQSDVVTLHAPLHAETHHLLNRQRIERMRHGAVIINTGRGSLVDTEALILGLESGMLGGAALDVLEGEEGVFYARHTLGSVENQLLVRLQRLSNVLITPHTAYYTDHALTDIVENTLLNCLQYERRTT